jgi:predicted aspartyl protease
MTDMGILRTTIEVAALDRPEAHATLYDVMVDTGSEYSWLPAELLAELGIVPVRIDRFKTADGRMMDRAVGFGMISAGGRTAPTVVGFAGPDDMLLLGAHALEGLNLRVDLVLRELVPAGAHPAASAA